MADRTITVDVQSNLKEQNDLAKQLNSTLEKLVSTLAKTNKRSKGSTGSRAADAALGASEAGLTRGTTGAGGRGGERDFARQAQGLGGLVHIYATFAANIYAVTAAFTALQKAADVSSMVQGADTLSARYGLSLRNVAKDLQQVSGEAISTASALSFATLGASAGVSQKQMKQLATVATGASKALGIDLNNAMQRIYRGAIKLEPELLDELGIMIKVDDASAEYARTLGKTALQLSDVEKHQAFANAIIEQGTRKFGEAAELAANPYTKLTAAMRDLGQSSLEVVNKALAPLVNLLAQSPTALLAVVSLIIGKLAKMAMPDLLPRAEERFSKASEQLTIAADKLKKTNKEIAKAFEETPAFKFISSDTKSRALKDAAPIIRSLQDAIERDIELTKPGQKVKLALDTESLRKQAEQALQIGLNRAKKPGPLAGSPKEVQNIQEMLNYVQNLSQGWDKVADSEMTQGKQRAAQNIATVQALKEQSNLKVAQLQLEGKHVAAIKAAWDGQRAITKELLIQNASYQKSGNLTSVSGVATTVANNLKNAFTSIGGAASGLGAVLKTAGTGVLSVLGTIGIYGAVLSMVGEAALAAAKHFGWLTDVFDKVGESADTLKSDFKVLEANLEKMSKAKSLQDIFELKEGQLKMIAETAKKLVEMREQLETAETKGTWIDKAIDRTKGVFGFSAQQQYTSTLAKEATLMGKAGTLDLAPTKEQLKNLMLSQQPEYAKKGYTKRYESMNLEELIAETDKFGKIGPDVAKVLKELEKQISDGGASASESSKAMAQASASEKELSKLTKDYVLTLAPQTAQTRVLAEANKSLIASFSGANAASKSFQSFSDELLIMAGVTDKVKIASFKKGQADLAQIDKDLAAQKISQEAAVTKRNKVLEDVKATELMTFAVDSMRATAEASATAAARAEASMAKLNAQLRKISAMDSAFGSTEASVRRRLALEDEMLKQEKKALREQQKYVTDALQVRTLSIQSQLSPGNKLTAESALGAIGAKQRSLENTPGGLYDPKNAEALAQYKELTAAADSLFNLKLAQSNLDQKMLAIDYKSKDAQERRIEITKQALQDTEKQRKLGEAGLALDYETSKKFNDVLVALAPELQGTNELMLTKLAIAKEYKEALDAETKAREELTFAEKEGADPSIIQRNRSALEQATQRLAGIDATKAERLDAARQTQLVARANLRAKSTESELTMQKTIAESNLTTSTQQYTAMQRIMALTTEEYNSKTKLTEEAVKGLQVEHKRLVDAGESIKAANLELAISSKLNEQKVAELKYQEEINKLRMQSAEKGMKSAEESGMGMFSGEYWQNIATYTEGYFAEARKNAKSVGATFVEGMNSAVDTISSGLTNMLQKHEFSWKGLANLVRSTFSDIFKDLATQFMKMALQTALFGQNTKSGGSTSGLLGLAMTGISSWLGSSYTTGLSTASTGAYTSGGVGNSAPFYVDVAAKGGIMTSEYGLVKAQKYEKGGIADSPQLAIFGEGRKNEAYVPLPDNRSIPVTLTSSPSKGVVMGDTNISINIASSGEANTSVSAENSAEFGKRLAEQVKIVVQKELMNESRPFGLLGRR